MSLAQYSFVLMCCLWIIKVWLNYLQSVYALIKKEGRNIFKRFFSNWSKLILVLKRISYYYVEFIWGAIHSYGHG